MSGAKSAVLATPVEDLGRLRMVPGGARSDGLAKTAGTHRRRMIRDSNFARALMDICRDSRDSKFRQALRRAVRDLNLYRRHRSVVEETLVEVSVHTYLLEASEMHYRANSEARGHDDKLDCLLRAERLNKKALEGLATTRLDPQRQGWLKGYLERSISNIREDIDRLEEEVIRTRDPDEWKDMLAQAKSRAENTEELVMSEGSEAHFRSKINNSEIEKIKYGIYACACWAAAGIIAGVGVLVVPISAFAFAAVSLPVAWGWRMMYQARNSSLEAFTMKKVVDDMHDRRKVGAAQEMKVP